MTTADSVRQSLYESRFDSLKGTPLIDVIANRRSRRFALGHDLDGGPLTYRSAHEPKPLTEEEEAVIVFAGSGFTGYTLGEAPFAPGKEPESSNGNIMVSTLGRTIASPDGVNSAILFVLNDDGAFQIRRPKDYPAEELAELADLARRHEFLEPLPAGEDSGRGSPPGSGAPAAPDSAVQPLVGERSGSTYFVLISDITPFVSRCSSSSSARRWGSPSSTTATTTGPPASSASCDRKAAIYTMTRTNSALLRSSISRAT